MPTRDIWKGLRISPCPFTADEIAELQTTNEMLVYLPAQVSMAELCERFGMRANIDFGNETLIRNVMVAEDQWFIASASNTPELLYRSARKAERVYATEGLLGMDLRRYLAFAGTFKYLTGAFPDRTYWTFLLSGSYDRSGVSIAGFDSAGVLNHHGWMRDFRSKFTGSRYIVLPPRIEITPETIGLKRAYRGSSSPEGKEAGCD